MTDKEFFYYTHKIYDHGHNDVLISKLEYFDGNVFGEIDLCNPNKRTYNSCEVVSIIKRHEMRHRDKSPKDYFYLQIGIGTLAFCIPISSDYVISYQEIKTPEGCILK